MKRILHSRMLYRLDNLSEWTFLGAEVPAVQFYYDM